MSNMIKPAATFIRPFFNDFFEADDFFKRSGGEMMRFKFPAVNIAENETNFLIDLAVPGFKKEDFVIKVEDDVMTIMAEKKDEQEEKEKNYSRKEYTHESFIRSFRLPENVKDDQVKAGYEDGILKLTLPKSEVQVKATKEIQVN
jgi:HSP20 family protein